MYKDKKGLAYPVDQITIFFSPWLYSISFQTMQLPSYYHSWLLRGIASIIQQILIVYPRELLLLYY